MRGDDDGEDEGVAAQTPLFFFFFLFFQDLKTRGGLGCAGGGWRFFFPVHFDGEGLGSCVGGGGCFFNSI